MGHLDGKVAIVTGAGQGIGEGIAVALAQEGAVVCATGRTPWKIERTAAQINERGGRAVGIVCDVTVAEQINAMVRQAAEQLGPPDILINNAQGGNDGRHGESFVESIAQTEAIEAYRGGPLASLAAMQACFPFFKERGGRIVNLASTTGVVGTPGFGPYSMAKEAIRALTKTAANEWGKYRITVNTICPAALSPAAIEWSEQDPVRFQEFLSGTPLGRLGDPITDIGKAVVHLVSDGMAYLTGATIMLDGGACILR